MKKLLQESAITEGRSRPKSMEEAKSKASGKKAKGKTRPWDWKPLFLRLWFLHAIFVMVSGIYVELTDKILKRYIPGYDTLPEQKRNKRLNRLLRKCKRKTKAKMDWIPANAPRSIRLPDGSERPATNEDYQRGATALLSGLLHLFPSETEGKRILAIIVCAMRCSSIRERFPEFYPHININKGADKLVDVFAVLIRCVVTKREWKKKHVRLSRDSILDFRAGMRDLRKMIADFTLLKVTRKGKTLVRLPAPYTDSLALVIGAEAEDIKGVAPYLEDTGGFFLGSAKPQSAEPVKVSQYNAYAPDALQVLQDNGPCIASLMRRYWENESEDWAERIEERVTASLSSGDCGRYVSVQYKPDLLRSAIYDVVLEDFLADLTADQLLSKEEHERWTALFWPTEPAQPEHEKELLSPTEPDTFLRIIQRMIVDNSARIVDFDQSYKKAKNPLGAWRNYNGAPYFMMLESTFEKEFPKAAKALGNVDVTVFSSDWLHPLEDDLKGHVLRVSSGLRYLRFDLLENGTRDKTHVVAIAKARLDGGNEEVLA